MVKKTSSNVVWAGYELEEKLFDDPCLKFVDVIKQQQQQLRSK